MKNSRNGSPKSTTPESREELGVTVYSGGFGPIRETRTLALSKRRSELEFGGVAGTTTLSVLLRDSASPASHQRPLFVYAGALVVAAALSWLLPGRQQHA